MTIGVSGGGKPCHDDYDVIPILAQKGGNVAENDKKGGKEGRLWLQVGGDGLVECDGSISPIRFLFGSCVLGWAGLGWAGLGWLITRQRWSGDRNNWSISDLISSVTSAHCHHCAEPGVTASLYWCLLSPSSFQINIFCVIYQQI